MDAPSHGLIGSDLRDRGALFPNAREGGPGRIQGTRNRTRVAYAPPGWRLSKEVLIAGVPVAYYLLRALDAASKQDLPLPLLVLGMLLVGGLLMVPVVLGLRRLAGARPWYRWKEHPLHAWARARGLEPFEPGEMGVIPMPFLEHRDEIALQAGARGTIGGHEADVQEVAYTVNSNQPEGGVRFRQWCTLVELELPVLFGELVPGIAVMPAGQPNVVGFTGARHLQFEKSGLERHFQVHSRGSEALAVIEHRLFGPQLLDQMGSTLWACWQQVGHRLTVFVPGRYLSAAELDELCRDAATVYRHYLRLVNVAAALPEADAPAA